eukprot:UN20082
MCNFFYYVVCVLECFTFLAI